MQFPKSPIYNKSALVQVMAWRWTGMPLPATMFTKIHDVIHGVTQPHLVKLLQNYNTYTHMIYTYAHVTANILKKILTHTQVYMYT